MKDILLKVEEIAITAVTLIFFILAGVMALMMLIIMFSMVFDIISGVDIVRDYIRPLMERMLS
jgi:hypothetical protein